MKDFTLTDKILGSCRDVKTDGNRLFAIQRHDDYPGGRLCVLDDNGKLLGEYVGIGEARQIEIKNNLAVVTARASGLWIFDIQEDTPKLLSHYKTIEYATGVALYANLAFISCRQYGIEVIDISAPCQPRHVRTIQTGEVQSACVNNGILYGGIWGTMKVLIFDIRNLDDPRLLAEIPLQGRGDGLIVKDNILYAATGQHKRGLVDSTDHNDPCFGVGNGVEMYDVADPADPRFLCRREFGYGHALFTDMWDANIAGDLLLCNVTVCGVHALDAKTFEPKFQLTFTDEDVAATGLTTFRGHLYVSSIGGLFRFSGYEFADLYHNDIDQTIIGQSETFTSESDRLTQRFTCDAPVLSVCPTEDGYALACAGGGIRLIDHDFHEILQEDTDGICYQVCCHKNRIYAALGGNGLSVYQRNGSALKLISHYQADMGIFQIDISESGRYLNCGYGVTQIALLDVSDPTAIKELTRRKCIIGPLYGSNFLSSRLADGSMGLMWHRDGLSLINPEKGEFTYRQYEYSRRTGFMGYGPENGCDTDGERIFFNLKKELILLPLHPCNLDDLPRYAADHLIEGKLTYHNNKIYAIERAKGLIQEYDISDLDNIKTLQYFRTNASCEKAVIIHGRVLIPGWYGGLLELI